jgi:uncharacterized protein YdeI (YjbR/CyaY-like superfamily)
MTAAQEEALCFGWIDQLSRSLDSSRFLLWSITNIRRVERLIQAGRMTEAGLEKVVEAKRNGQWAAALAREHTDLIPERRLEAIVREAAESC